MTNDGTIKKKKKNTGITHALKNLVESNKDAVISDGKITASEWNAAMDKIAEINQHRKAEGKESIFTGKTDKTKAGWHNSFIVQDKQQIELTKQELDEIYTAMGVSFKTTKKERPEMTKLGEVSHTFNVNALSLCQTGIKIPEKSGAKIPSQDKNPPKTDKKHPKRDKNIPDDYTHSLKLPENVYDKAGRIIAVKNENGQTVREISRNPDGAVVEYHDYEYNENGELVKDITRKSNGTISEYYECEYNEAGNVIREITRNPDGSVKEYYDWLYDKEGRETQSIRRNSNGKVIDYWEITYDKNGKSTLTIRNADGSIQE